MLYSELSMCKDENTYLEEIPWWRKGWDSMLSLPRPKLDPWLGIRSTSQMGHSGPGFCPPAPPTAPPWEPAPWLWSSMTRSTCAKCSVHSRLSWWTTAGCILGCPLPIPWRLNSPRSLLQPGSRGSAASQTLLNPWTPLLSWARPCTTSGPYPQV